jgi:hypothetical protein
MLLNISKGGVRLIIGTGNRKQVRDMWQVTKRRHGDSSGWRSNRKPWPVAIRALASALGVLAIAGMLAALAAACGGGGEPEDEGSPTPPPAGADACQALQALNTYRYSMTLNVDSPQPEDTPVAPEPTPDTTPIIRDFTEDWGFEYNVDASYVAPDRLEANISGVGIPFTMILIGGEAWTLLEGTWRPATQAQIPYRPPVVCDGVLPDLDLSKGDPQEEKVNDVESIHYSFSQLPLEQAWAKIYGTGSDLDVLLKKLDVDVWLAKKDGWPTRIDIRSSGQYGDGRELRAQLLLDITDANSGDIRVEPPSS